MKTIVHLVRHGEVDNPERVLYGRLPGYRLSAAGEEMAVKAAAHLAGRDITWLASSPLERALQTAAPIAAETGLQVHQDQRLIEAGNSFQGQRVAGGQGHELYRPRYWPRYRNPFRPSWGEPYAEIAVRMQAAIEAAREAAEGAGGTEAVCVSHQLPIVVATRSARGEHLWHYPPHRRCALASVTSFSYDGDRLVGVDYAEPAGETPPGAVAGA